MVITNYVGDNGWAFLTYGNNADNVVIKAVIPEERRKDIENKIIEHTHAAALIEWKEKVTFAQHEKEVLIWENNL